MQHIVAVHLPPSGKVLRMGRGQPEKFQIRPALFPLPALFSSLLRKDMLSRSVAEAGASHFH